MTTAGGMRSGATAVDAPRTVMPTAGALAAVTILTALGFVTGVGPRHPVWTVPVAMLVTVGVGRPRPDIGVDRRALGVCAGAVVAFLVGSLPFGLGPVPAILMAVANLGVGLLVGGTYERFRRGHGWILDEPSDVALIGLLGAVGGVALVALGAVPAAARDMSTACAVSRDLVVALLVAVPLMSRVRPALRTEHRGRVPLMAAVWIVAVALPVLVPTTPIAWALLAPALWGGVSLGLRLAAVFAAAQIVLVEAGRWALGPGPRPGDAALDQLLVFVTLLLFMLVAYRERAERLAADLRMRADQDALDGAVLDDVVRAMDDGVVLTDDGRIVMANPSARRLLGLTPSARTLPDRLEEAGFCDESGAPPPPGTFDVVFAPPADRFAHITLTTPAGPGLEAGRFDLAVRSVVVDGRRLALVVITDGTVQHARRRELETSAGSVAQDLKTPLAGTRRWIEMADAQLERGALDPAGHALGQADLSATRMRGMIDDYLAYTVAREGVLRVASVPLRPLVDEVLADVPFPSLVVQDIETPHVVQADASLVRRLLANLFADTVAGVDEDERVRLHIRSESGDAGWVRVVVEDDRGRLRRGDDESIFGVTETDETEEAGPGDALCRAVVGRHGGRIERRRLEDGRTSVAFTLPLAEDVTVS